MCLFVFEGKIFIFLLYLSDLFILIYRTIYIVSKFNKKLEHFSISAFDHTSCFTATALLDMAINCPLSSLSLTNGRMNDENEQWTEVLKNLICIKEIKLNRGRGSLDNIFDSLYQYAPTIEKLNIHDCFDLVSANQKILRLKEKGIEITFNQKTL